MSVANGLLRSPDNLRADFTTSFDIDFGRRRINGVQYNDDDFLREMRNRAPRLFPPFANSRLEADALVIEP